MSPMQTLLAILVVIGLLATFGTMFAGILGVGKDGGAARSNKLMQYRVIFQAVAILLFGAMMFLIRR